MKEIKLRAWDERGRKMHFAEYDETKGISAFNIYGNGMWELVKIPHRGGIPLGEEEVVLSGEASELMQSTGLKDSKGREIFEGDICQTEWNGKTIVAPMFFNGAKAQFGLMAVVTFKSPDHIADVPVPPTIVGNVFENADMLE